MSIFSLNSDFYATIADVGGPSTTAAIYHYAADGAVLDSVEIDFGYFTIPSKGGVIWGNYLYLDVYDQGLMKFDKNDLSTYEIVSGGGSGVGLTYCNGLYPADDFFLQSPYPAYSGQYCTSYGQIIYFTSIGGPVIGLYDPSTGTYPTPFATTYGSYFTGPIAATPSGHLYVLTGDGSPTYYIEQLDAVSGAILNVTTIAAVDTSLESLYGLIVSPDESVAYICWVDPAYSSPVNSNWIATVPLPGGGFTDFLPLPVPPGTFSGLINASFPLKPPLIPLRQRQRDDGLTVGPARVNLGQNKPRSRQVGIRSTVANSYV